MYGNIDFEGVIGLGNPDLAIGSSIYNAGEYPFTETWADILRNNGQTPSDMWSVNIDLWSKSGSITFGGLDPVISQSEEIYTWVPIPGYFMIAFDGIRFNSNELIINLSGSTI